MASSYLLHSGTSGKLSYPAKLQNTKILKITLYVPLMQNDLIKSSICNQTAHPAWETALFCWLTTLPGSFDGVNVFAVCWLVSTTSMRGHNCLLSDFATYQTDNRNIFGLIDWVQDWGCNVIQACQTQELPSWELDTGRPAYEVQRRGRAVMHHEGSQRLW